ncbi:MAG: pyruvate:ferredoxin (flavodoxin) oxidoreductase [Acidimicrobiales bacterium]
MSDGVTHRQITVDGNEAAARIAHRLSEVIAIYPITPASPMGELADAWTQRGVENLWGSVPDVIEMQSEAGAAGTLHGALQAGALATTFTASQGLLLMIPNLYKIAGELTPAVVHVAARSVATHALSIFGDHSDVMAVRPTGMAMLASASVQEAQDLALIAHAATLRTRVPFLHFFDGFRTSHEVATIDAIDDEVLRAMIDDELVERHRRHGLDPNRPVLRGTAQNPDVFFQAREAANPFHLATPAAVRAEMDRFAELTGRRYGLFERWGAHDAERVIVMMGSGLGAAVEAVEAAVARGEKVAVIGVRLYRPFDTAAFDAIVPPTVRSMAVLDRTKEPGSVGEPLYTDVVTALVERRGYAMPRIIGGRYGLSSKEFTPAMVLSVLDELAAPAPKNHFTVGIVDDVTHTSLAVDETRWTEPDEVVRAVFYGLGSDGTVGANKNSVKIIGAETDLYAQGYFVYDSKKSGSMTISHLRFGPEPIRSSYLIREADFVACHHTGFLDTLDVVGVARPGATLLLNTPHGPDDVWETLPREVQHQIIDKGLDLWVVDAGRVARDAGLGRRVNTVLQTCFFSLAGILDTDDAIAAIKRAITKTYATAGALVLERNHAAVDRALDALARVDVPDAVAGDRSMAPVVPAEAPEFVQRVTAMMLAHQGDLLPVSALPVDGTFPLATSQWEKRTIASEIPIWDPEICIDCARCSLVCPHAAIRMKVIDADALDDAPATFRSKPWTGDHDDGDRRLIIQVAPDDCTGCGVCVSICPAKSRTEAKHKAIDMTPLGEHLDDERINFAHFLSLPDPDRSTLDLTSIKGTQQARPLFEFSGACAGCGETPYLKLLSQQFGDRITIANATGCSSIYGANLPTTPWAVDDAGRGPAWANSLFEDNAEFGLGIRMALDHHGAEARRLLAGLVGEIGPLAAEILDADQSSEAGVIAQRRRVEQLRMLLGELQVRPGRSADAATTAAVDRLASSADSLVRTGVWIVGGDGWAYDIGFGGLDHVLESGRDVNVLVLDTEVYSNTGGQTSKATPRAAVAKFSAGGKRTGKKDLGMIAMSYGDVYVAQVAMGANMTQTVKAFAEAEAHPGPSLIIAYSPCIAHGIDMRDMMGHQKMAADSGYWPMYRYDPRREGRGEHGLHLDSRRPKVAFADFAKSEARFAILSRTDPAAADELFSQAQRDIDDRWHLYEQMVEVERSATFGEIEE